MQNDTAVECVLYIEIMCFQSIQRNKGLCFNVGRIEMLSGFPSLPVIAPAWLPALLKIAVQNLCVPEDQKKGPFKS